MSGATEKNKTKRRFSKDRPAPGEQELRQDSSFSKTMSDSPDQDNACPAAWGEWSEKRKRDDKNSRLEMVSELFKHALTLKKKNKQKAKSQANCMCIF